MQNIKIRDIIPGSRGKKGKESKLMIREAVLTKIGTNIDHVRKRCSGKPLSLSVDFFLHKKSYDKNDLTDLLNTVVKILGEEMSSKKDNLKGLGIVSSSNFLNRIIVEKNIIEKKDDEWFSFSVYEWE